ncbi:MAG TPA: methylenetetrahydrofolate reductase [Streptosporangiaceae bacterium]
MRQAAAIAPAPAGTRGALQAALEGGAFTVTAEVGPPRSADTEAIRRKVAALRGFVTAVNLTDNQSAMARMANWAASLVAMAAGVPPIMQLTCRDRNRIMLQSELLAAGAMGIPNIVVMTGDHPRFGDHPDAKPVFDLDSIGLLWVARTLRDEGRLMSGRSLAVSPDWFLGAVENPFAPPLSFRAARLGKKIAAGAQFVQTQYVFDVEMFGRWLAQVRDLGLDDRCHIIAGVGPIMSLRALDHLQHRVPGVYIPHDVARRLLAVPAGQTADEGMKVCAEIIGELRRMPGVAGIHMIATGNEHRIPDILQLAGVAAGATRAH